MQCRCCLSRQLPLFELFELNLDVILTSVASVEVEPHDGLPAFVCEECVGKAKASLKFRRQCERVDQSMRRLLEFSRQRCETDQSGHDDGTGDGFIRAESNLEDAATLPPDVIGDDRLSLPFDHDYCRSFDPESLEMLDECLETEKELFLEREIPPDQNDPDPVREQLDSDRDESEGSNEDTRSSSTDNSVVLCIEAADEFIETDNFRENDPQDEGSSPRWKTAPAGLPTVPGPKREREQHVCDRCGRGFSRSTFMRQHTVRCASRRADLPRGTRYQPAVLFCELCRRTFRSQHFLWRHRQICKGRAEHDFVRDVVEYYTDKEFRKHFRMTRTTVDSLVDSFRRSEFYRVRITGGRQEIPARAQILSFLWFCGKSTTFGKVCRTFRVAMASFHKHMNLILDFLHQMARDVIKLPESSEEKGQLSLQFAEIIPLMNVLGCIDSWFIDCTRHKEANAGTDAVKNTGANGSRRKPGCGILLQAIAGPSGKFMDVNTELTYSMDLDAGRLFSRSALACRLDSVCQNGRFHLLGSSPYPLRPYLLTPFATGSSNAYSNMPASDPKVSAYNNTLQAALENTILKAFRALRRRFPVLAKLRFCSREKVARFVLACCVLHNFCIDAGDIGTVDEADHDEDHEMEEQEELVAFTAVRFWQRPFCERSADDVAELIEAGKAKRDHISMSIVA
uniref:ZAD domain-containing protein n=1 Tax=Anopheles atroparvus TaxID=41427 RepID=A0AAG5DK10_ANOAO